MKTGDKVTCELFADGSRFELELDDVVYPDRTYGQYDAGFYAYCAEDEESNYFVSINDGTVYTDEEHEHDEGFCTKPIGRIVNFKEQHAT